MEERSRLRHVLAGWLTAVGFLLASGCGTDDGLGRRYPVSGNVTYQGKPLEKGQISFISKTPEARTATGDIENGYYRLTTLTDGDGAIPGKYGVTIIAKSPDYAQLLEKSKGGIPHQRDAMKVNQEAKRLIPAKYEQEKTSGLDQEVKAQSNTINFELKD